MPSPARDIIEFLASSGVDVGVIGATTGWSLNAHKEPSQPDTTLTAYDTPGEGFDVDAGFERPSVQLRARGIDYDAAESKLREAILALITPLEFEINSRRYFAWLADGINNIGTDDRQRYILTANLNLYRPTGG